MPELVVPPALHRQPSPCHLITMEGQPLPPLRSAHRAPKPNTSASLALQVSAVCVSCSQAPEHTAGTAPQILQSSGKVSTSLPAHVLEEECHTHLVPSSEQVMDKTVK